jgi:hypothetical protein
MIAVTAALVRIWAGGSVAPLTQAREAGGSDPHGDAVADGPLGDCRHCGGADDAGRGQPDPRPRRGLCCHHGCVLAGPLPAVVACGALSASGCSARVRASAGGGASRAGGYGGRPECTGRCRYQGHPVCRGAAPEAVLLCPWHSACLTARRGDSTSQRRTCKRGWQLAGSWWGRFGSVRIAVTRLVGMA